MKKYMLIVITLLCFMVPSTVMASGEYEARESDLKTYRERANSDDAESVKEAFFHGEARALVILNIEPNSLHVGGREFRVKRNPVGKGCFVYDPRTRIGGVDRHLIWWVPDEFRAYPLNGGSKKITPSLKWAREGRYDAARIWEAVDYVFEGKPMTAPDPRPKVGSYKVKEYRIYRAVISTPMSVSDAQALENVAKRYGVTVEEAKKTTKKVLYILSRNGWFGSPDSEIRHASDWKEEETNKFVSDKATKLDYKKVLPYGIARFLYMVKYGKINLEDGLKALLWSKPGSNDVRLDSAFEISQILEDAVIYDLSEYQGDELIEFTIIIPREDKKLYMEGQKLSGEYFTYEGPFTYTTVFGARRTIQIFRHVVLE